MVDLNEIRISGDNFSAFCNSWSNAMRSIPGEVAQEVARIRSAYLSRGSFNMFYQRMNNRTVAQILAEFDDLEIPAVRSGRFEGGDFKLYGAPKDHDDSGK